jgi:hypothetical protein
MSTRRRCSTPECFGYFTPRHNLDTRCPECVARAIDKEIGEISQDNTEAGPFLRPIDAMSLAQARIELATMVHERNRWKAFALSNWATIAAIAAPRQLLGNQTGLARRQIEITYADFPDLMDEIEGPAYRRQG